MMRPSRLRLPASLFAAITAQQGIKLAPANLRRNCNAKINNSIRLLSMGAVRFICRSKETQSLKRSFHNASDEDDSSALGPLAGKGETELRKLVTEKPDLYEKRNPTRKALSGSSLPAKRSKEIISPSPEIETLKNVYRFDINNKCSSNIRKPNSVCIKNVPSVLGLSQLKEALSAFGIISHSSKRTRQNELDLKIYIHLISLFAPLLSLCMVI
ncbi:uncharacterized protein LOC107426234 [Ziziphus jujuba]|uniref:Uncharacterized protein LOC107426234 n=1 Tax=Ziziphus jujuba TaxID=326968 RepID=A0ABM3IXL7_ZIZJJ|nr:uncharacterized protein LOC107426234 [Ziziphus jujuba]